MGQTQHQEFEASARRMVQALGCHSWGVHSTFHVLMTDLYRSLVVQVVRVAAGAELDPVGAFGGQHIYSGLDNQGMAVKAHRRGGDVHTCRNSPEETRH